MSDHSGRLCTRSWLQWVHGPRTVVMHRGHGQVTRRWQGFNGSTVREPWLCTGQGVLAAASCRASMGPRSENRGYAGVARGHHGARVAASMGPRSENRGYACRPNSRMATDGIRFNGSTVREPWLCMTVAAIDGRGGAGFNGSTVREPWLCGRTGQAREAECCASMGPRSENRGYDGRQHATRGQRIRGFNGSTVREPWLWHMRTALGRRSNSSFNGSTVREPWLCSLRIAVLCYRRRASMGPRSENRGYGWLPTRAESAADWLQWVHGPRTVVMRPDTVECRCACTELQWVHGRITVVMLARDGDLDGDSTGFNGSTVREPWLWSAVWHCGALQP